MPSRLPRNPNLSVLEALSIAQETKPHEPIPIQNQSKLPIRKPWSPNEPNPVQEKLQSGASAAPPVMTSSVIVKKRRGRPANETKEMEWQGGKEDVRRGVELANTANLLPFEMLIAEQPCPLDG